jgi:HAD superfamily hydrolase (TIGR01509 family)
MIDAALLDIDGTLIDNTALHVLAWQRAFRRIGREIDANTLLHKIGMGGDQLAPSILGGDGEREEAKRVQQYHSEEYTRKGLIDHAEVLPGAREFITGLKERGVRVAFASSAKQEEADRYIRMLDVGGQLDALVTAEDVDASKPAPDVFAVALGKLGKPGRALAFGDTVYDVESAGRLGIPCVCVLSGGIERDLLVRAGAVAVYRDAADMCRNLAAILEGSAGH